MIQWEEARDRHVKGRCEFGDLWIRLDPIGKPTGVYTMFGRTQKFVTDEDDTLEDAKTIAELAIEDVKLQQKRDRDLDR